MAPVREQGRLCVHDTDEADQLFSRGVDDEARAGGECSTVELMVLSAQHDATDKTSDEPGTLSSRGSERVDIESEDDNEGDYIGELSLVI
jgi:hypothetical protein